MFMCLKGAQTKFKSKINLAKGKGFFFWFNLNFRLREPEPVFMSLIQRSVWVCEQNGEPQSLITGSLIWPQWIIQWVPQGFFSSKCQEAIFYAVLRLCGWMLLLAWKCQMHYCAFALLTLLTNRPTVTGSYVSAGEVWTSFLRMVLFIGWPIHMLHISVRESIQTGRIADSLAFWRN